MNCRKRAGERQQRVGNKVSIVSEISVGFTLSWVQCPAACGVILAERVCVEVRA